MALTKHYKSTLLQLQLHQTDNIPQNVLPLLHIIIIHFSIIWLRLSFSRPMDLCTKYGRECMMQKWQRRNFSNNFETILEEHKKRINRKLLCHCERIKMSSSVTFIDHWYTNFSNAIQVEGRWCHRKNNKICKQNLVSIIRRPTHSVHQDMDMLWKCSCLIEDQDSSVSVIVYQSLYWRTLMGPVQKIVKVILLSACCDTPAWCLFQNLTQFNGKHGCPYCTQRGESVKTSECGFTHTYIWFKFISPCIWEPS